MVTLTQSTYWKMGCMQGDVVTLCYCPSLYLNVCQELSLNNILNQTLLYCFLRCDCSVDEEMFL